MVTTVIQKFPYAFIVLRHVLFLMIMWYMIAGFLILTIKTTVFTSLSVKEILLNVL